MSWTDPKQLSRQEENEEVEVRREDQDKINRFSTLHRKAGNLEEELKVKQVRPLSFRIHLFICPTRAEKT